MKEERFATPTLPSVLFEYVPNEDERSKSEEEDRTAKSDDENGLPDTTNTVSTKNEHTVKRKKSSRPKSHKHEEKTWHYGNHRGTEKERLEWVADTWDQAKAEILQERHDILNRKLVLQQALVKAQDRRAQQRRKSEQEAELRKRAETKRVRSEKLAALEGQCKQSLASDRKTKHKPRTLSETTDQQSQQNGGANGYSSDAGSATTATSGGGVGRRERTKSHGGYLPSDAYAGGDAMLDTEIEEEDDDDEVVASAADGVVTPADLSSVPWHHAQLYKMYGRNADYYIHPKMQVEKKKVVHPTLKRQKGHLGAGHIWTTLRSDSTKKLLRTDRRFPAELKDAFSSHVREGITNHKKPVFRNFTENEDVPDLPRLLDQSLLRRIRVLRHKTELMYRSSQTNHDRTKILLFNSPLPDVNEGDQGIEKYLPSWDFDNISVTSEPSYMKWLKSARQEDQKPELSAAVTDWEAEDGGETEKVVKENGRAHYLPTDKTPREEDDTDQELKDSRQDNMAPQPAHRRMWHPQSVLSPLGSEVSDGLHDIWHKVMVRQRPRKEPRYHFLTEDEARVQGEFLTKLGLEPDKIDRGRTDLLPQLNARGHTGGIGGRLSQGQINRQSLPGSVKAMSAPRGSRGPTGLHHSVSGHLRTESAQSPSEMSLQRYETTWQPLSMQALIEYKEQLGTEGAGEFQQGRPIMWKTGEATASAK